MIFIRKQRVFSCLALAISVLGFAPEAPAFADALAPAHADASAGPGLAPDELMIETVVVTAEQRAHASVSTGGASVYTVTAGDIADLPAGQDAPLSDVLAQMPGVAIDQNQQIHIRDTEGPQFQYQLDGAMVPLDINTNPSFLSMLNPRSVDQLSLLTGVLPSRYSYATGGIVDIDTKTGCNARGGSATLFGGQRSVLEPSIDYGGCDDSVGWFASAQYEQGNDAFSSATPGPNPIHDWTNQGQAFGNVTWDLGAGSRLNFIASVAASDNQLPNVPGLTPQFTLAGAAPIPSAAINSYLDFRDGLGIVILDGTFSSSLTYKLAYAAHYIEEDFRPDDIGELIFEGVASKATHRDLDNTLEGDLDWKKGAHDVTAGFYFGEYGVVADDTSLVFPVNSSGVPGDVPVTVVNNARATNIVTGIYLNDLWTLSKTLHLNAGIRWDDLIGFSHHNQLNGTLGVTWRATPVDTLHAGIARYMQVPSFLGISPTASEAFAATTAAGPPGISTPLAEDDDEVDAGILHDFGRGFTLSWDGYYEVTHHYLDTGQFGVVPIFAPFNYGHGTMWGSELALGWSNGGPLSGYANLTIGRNLQEGVATGQFNFDPAELVYIDTHHIVLDHQPLFGVAAGAAYDLKPWKFSADAIYSSGLRAGFADTEQLPNVVQVNASIERSFDIGGRQISDRLVLLNLFDRVNLIRPANGIGIFQSAYGPRFTVYDALMISLP